MNLITLPTAPITREIIFITSSDLHVKLPNSRRKAELKEVFGYLSFM